jgi:hypothetical protein
MNTTTPTPATTPSTKTAFCRRCQQAIDNGEGVILYAPFAPQGVPRNVSKVRSSDIIFLTGAGKESYFRFEKNGTVHNDGAVWTLDVEDAGGITCVFPS